MKKASASMISILLAFPLVVVATEIASDENTELQSVLAASEGAPVESADTTKASIDTTMPAATGDSETAAPGSASKSGTEKTPADDKPVDSIDGAFGIRLGERFSPSKVAKVLVEQQQTYRGPGGVERKGALIRVKPGQPDKRFQRVMVRTTEDGIVYAVQGDFQFEAEKVKDKQEKAEQSRSIQLACKTMVKSLAADLEARYGKPRGKGMHDQWVSFRQISDTGNKSVRLYGHRCRTGMYSIIYTDENVKWERDGMGQGRGGPGYGNGPGDGQGRGGPGEVGRGSHRFGTEQHPLADSAVDSQAEIKADGNKLE